MYPILFSIGEFQMPAYGVAYLTAFLAAVAVGSHLIAQHFGKPFKNVVEIGFQSAITGEIGARVTFVIVEWDRFADGGITFWQFLIGGRVVLGGALIGLACGAWLFYRQGFTAGPVLDAISVAIALGMGIGRIGCLLGGCCYGAPTTLWWGITFTDPVAQRINGTILNTPLHPTQPLQMVIAFLIFGALWWVYHHKRFHGQVLATYLLLAGLMRFGMEFLRGDDRGQALGLATSQWIGLTMVAGATVWLTWRLVLNRDSLDVRGAR